MHEIPIQPDGNLFLFFAPAIINPIFNLNYPFYGVFRQLPSLIRKLNLRASPVKSVDFKNSVTLHLFDCGVDR